ncbi:hypothetical protein L596_002791 [Steinernema carpocapsae]|uniref:Uncharacterized protein n=1 Tax=Steinernema carpocapsae TaxID=34508 RepID=A0A4U8UQL5_STECR|nr:hypothetical protein L596_002791 [Steinernema carpocapsae]
MMRDGNRSKASSEKLLFLFAFDRAHDIHKINDRRMLVRIDVVQDEFTVSSIPFRSNLTREHQGLHSLGRIDIASRWMDPHDETHHKLEDFVLKHCVEGTTSFWIAHVMIIHVC